jgi:hypothetical protein
MASATSRAGFATDFAGLVHGSSGARPESAVSSGSAGGGAPAQRQRDVAQGRALRGRRVRTQPQPSVE